MISSLKIKTIFCNRNLLQNHTVFSYANLYQKHLPYAYFFFLSSRNMKLLHLLVITITTYVIHAEPVIEYCWTKFNGEYKYIQFGREMWFDPCYFCWCYEGGDPRDRPTRAGCNTVDCPYIECPPGTQLQPVKNKCCLECMAI